VEIDLTLLLTVHNDESRLEQRVHELLDAAPEITRRFEIVIVDDGSQDATEEIAHDLARRFPQVRTVRHTLPRGRETSVATGRLAADGRVVIVQNIDRPLTAVQLARLWSARRDQAELTTNNRRVAGAVKRLLGLARKRPTESTDYDTARLQRAAGG